MQQLNPFLHWYEMILCNSEEIYWKPTRATKKSVKASVQRSGCSVLNLFFFSIKVHLSPDQSCLLSSTSCYAHTDVPSGSGFICLVVVFSWVISGVLWPNVHIYWPNKNSSELKTSRLPKQPSCFHFGPTAEMGFIVHWKSLMCCVA